MIKLIKSLKMQAVLIFFLISAFVVVTWFRGEFIYGGAEVGLFGYNPERRLEISKYVWWGAVAPGQLIPHFITGVPIYFCFYIFKLISLSSQNIQQLFFFSAIFLMDYGMFLLAWSILDDRSKKYSVISGLFYMFNAYILVMVWHRFLYSIMVLAAALPFLILFWRKWIKDGEFSDLTIFLLINFLSVYMYGNLASVITVWIALTLISLAEMFFPWQGKFNAWRLSGRFLAGFILWLLTNMWWIAPTFSIAPGLLPEQHSSEDNLGTLVSVSRQAIMPYLLQLANPYYLFYRSELGQVYSSFIFKVIPWIMSAVIFTGMMASLKLKNYAVYSVIFIIAVILAKGSAAPFSYPYIFGFEHFYILGVLRNPFEKLGIILPLFGAILFSLGLKTFLDWSIKYIGSKATGLVLMLILVALVGYAWPMLGGKVFGTKELPAKVKVPESYVRADEWLKQQKEDQGVVLHLPFAGKDVVTYDWDEGYHGVDQNEILFTALPSLSRMVGIKRVDDTLSSLTYIFNPPFSEDKKQILKVLQSFNIKYIILHNDTTWKDIATYGKDIKLIDPSEIEATLNNLDFLEKVSTFDNLIIYKLQNQYSQPKIILFDTAHLVYPGESNIMQIMSFTQNKSQIITAEYNDLAEPILSAVKEISIFPQNTLQYSIASESALINMASSMLFNSDSPDSVMNQLKAMKVYFSQAGQVTNEGLVGKIIVASENLIKLYNLTRQPTGKLEFSAFDDYADSLKDIFKNNFRTLSLMKLYKPQITNIFYLHLYILEQISRNGLDKQQRISEIHTNLMNFLRENDLLPIYLQSYLPDKQEISRKILQFKISTKSKYGILMSSHDTSDLSPDLFSKLDLRINDKPLTAQGKIDKNIISFGTEDLDKGIYEISYNSLLSSNLVPALDKFLKVGNVEPENSETMRLISNEGGIAYLESPIKAVIGGDILKISVDAISKKGTEFYIEVIQSTEYFDKKEQYQTFQPSECAMHNCYPLKPNINKTDWQKYTFSIPALNLANQKANIRIFIASGEILVKNFQVSRVYGENVVLRKELKESSESSSSGSVTTNYQNTIAYTGKVRIEKPSFLFFKETFHPGWTLQLTKDGNVQTIDKHFLGNFYGNVWWIDKPGDFDFKIEFTPQRNVNKGIFVAISTYILLILINCYTYLKGLFRR